MEIQQKLRVLADAAKYDASCASSGSKRARAQGGLGNTDGGHLTGSRTLQAVAPWFRNRFGAMHWSILTPFRSAHWKQAEMPIRNWADAAGGRVNSDASPGSRYSGDANGHTTKDVSGAMGAADTKLS